MRIIVAVEAIIDYLKRISSLTSVLWLQNKPFSVISHSHTKLSSTKLLCLGSMLQSDQKLLVLRSISNNNSRRGKESEIFPTFLVINIDFIYDIIKIYFIYDITDGKH